MDLSISYHSKLGETLHILLIDHPFAHRLFPVICVPSVEFRISPASRRVRVYGLVIRTNWQGELKDGTSGRICLYQQLSSVSFDNRTADQQSHSKALRLRRIEGLEKTVESARIQAWTRISYCNQYMRSCSADRAFAEGLAFVRFIGNLSNFL
jgi:hypothetical protein